MKNKSGLSTIVITLILIVISLVAVGVVWSVVNNLIKGTNQGIDINSKCLNVVVEATAVNCSSVGVSRICDAQLMRSGTGSDAIDGVKLVFRNITSGTSSSLLSVNGNIEKLVGKKQTGINTTLVGVNKLEITVFFKDTAGNEQYCSQKTDFTNFS